MLRSFLLGILTVSAVASCKGKEAGPAVQAGVTAGKVTELTGTVTAKRGTESRALTSGTEVSGDDVIETAANSTVSIVLAHNNATWSLGPNKREKVADSMAWSLAKVDQPALGAAESTTAAGRHAERAGANTGATATADGAADPGAPPSPASATVAAPTTATTAPPTAPITAPSAQAVAPGSGPAPNRPARAVVAPKDEAPRGGGSLGLRGTGEGGGGRGDGIGLGGSNTRMGKGGSKASESNIVVEAPPPPPPPPPPPEVTDALKEIQVLAARDRDKLNACLDASTPSLSVTLAIVQGKATFELPSGTPPAVASCLAKVAAAIKPSAKLTAKLPMKIASSEKSP